MRPKPASCTAANCIALFDYLVRDGKQGGWHGEARPHLGGELSRWRRGILLLPAKHQVTMDGTRSVQSRPRPAEHADAVAFALDHATTTSPAALLTPLYDGPRRADHLPPFGETSSGEPRPAWTFWKCSCAERSSARASRMSRRAALKSAKAPPTSIPSLIADSPLLEVPATCVTTRRNGFTSRSRFCEKARPITRRV